MEITLNFWIEECEMSLSRIFNIASGSLSAYQNALDVTSHNIANSSNPDYSRQKVDIAARQPDKNANFIWGNGVKIEDISRVRNVLTDSQIRSNNQIYSNNNQRDILLGQVEDLFAEPSSSGLGSLMTDFYNSWQKLSVSPNSMPLRDNLIQATQNMSDKIKNVSDGLQNIQQSILNQTKQKVTDLNSQLEQLQTLNKQIFNAQINSSNANDLMDKRDKILDSLSNLANVNISYDSSNNAIVSIGGVFAADQTTHATFTAKEVNGKLSLTTSDGSTKVNLSGGELYALTDVFSNKIPEYQNKLNDVVTNLMNNVNSAHKSGYNLGSPPQTSLSFFDSYSNGSLTINPEILNDHSKIAVSSDGTSGNGDIATQIGDQANQNLLNGTTLSDNYNNLISQIGNDKQKANQNTTSYKAVLDQLNNQKASYSGVSIDEEMTIVIKYQRSYDASAKMVKVADEMLQTLINMV